MRKKQTLTPCPSSQETLRGFVYLAFMLLVLPGLLEVCNRQFSWKLTPAEMNFTFFFLNFLAILLIFHQFLGRAVKQAFQHPAYLCQAVILGTAAYFACTYAIQWLIAQINPGFANANDLSIAQMGRSSRLLMFLGTVVLVPPVEECLYRGLIFRNLYGKSPAAAYAVSMAAFALIHVMGYLGSYSLGELTLALLQYLPAGLCLAWAYTKSGTIAAPIVIHALVNALGMYRMR